MKRGGSPRISARHLQRHDVARTRDIAAIIAQGVAAVAVELDRQILGGGRSAVILLV